MRIFVVLSIVALLSVIVTYLLHGIFKQKKYAKYVFSIMALLVAVYNFLMARLAPHEGLEDLARIVVFLFAAIAFISSVVFAVFLDWKNRS